MMGVRPGGHPASRKEADWAQDKEAGPVRVLPISLRTTKSFGPRTKTMGGSTRPERRACLSPIEAMKGMARQYSKRTTRSSGDSATDAGSPFQSAREAAERSSWMNEPNWRTD